MERKYQIWANLDLVGHITGDNVTMEDAIAYAILHDHPRKTHLS
jgi:hypothetical protein